MLIYDHNNSNKNNNQRTYYAHTIKRNSFNYPYVPSLNKSFGKYFYKEIIISSKLFVTYIFFSSDGRELYS
jgi:hypothetical protein